MAISGVTQDTVKVSLLPSTGTGALHVLVPWTVGTAGAFCAPELSS